MSFTSSNTVEINQWNHVCFTYDKTLSNINLYVNGKKSQYASNIDFSINGESSLADIFIGVDKRVSETPNFMYGNIDEIVLYNKRLSDIELTEIMNSNLSKFLTEPFMNINNNPLYNSISLTNNITNEIGTATGNVSSGEHVYPGVQGIQFDPNSFIELPSSNLNSNVISVGSWIKTENIENQTFIKKDDAFELGTNSKGEISFLLNNQSNLDQFKFINNVGFGDDSEKYDAEHLLTRLYDVNTVFDDSDYTNLVNYVSLLPFDYNPDDTLANNAEVAHALQVNLVTSHWNNTLYQSIKHDSKLVWQWMSDMLPYGNEKTFYSSTMRGGFAATKHSGLANHPHLIWDMKVKTNVTKFYFGHGTTTQWTHSTTFKVWWSNDNITYTVIDKEFSGNSLHDLTEYNLFCSYFGIEIYVIGQNLVLGNIRIIGKQLSPLPRIQPFIHFPLDNSLDSVSSLNNQISSNNISYSDSFNQTGLTCVKFNGSNSFVNFGKVFSSIDDPNHISISTWFNIDDLSKNISPLLSIRNGLELWVQPNENPIFEHSKLVINNSEILKITIDDSKYTLVDDTIDNEDDQHTPWILILNYTKHKDYTGENTVLTSNPPILPTDNRLDFDNVNITTFVDNDGTVMENGLEYDKNSWGHVGSKLFDQICMALGSESGTDGTDAGLELRWIGKTSEHDRIIHYKTTSGIKYARNLNNSRNEYIQYRQDIHDHYQLFNNHTANFPIHLYNNSANESYYIHNTDISNTQNGNYIFNYNYFSHNTNHHLSLGEGTVRNYWALDGLSDASQNSHIYSQLWIRAKKNETNKINLINNKNLQLNSSLGLYFVNNPETFEITNISSSGDVDFIIETTISREYYILAVSSFIDPHDVFVSKYKSYGGKISGSNSNTSQHISTFVEHVFNTDGTMYPIKSSNEFYVYIILSSGIIQDSNIVTYSSFPKIVTQQSPSLSVFSIIYNDGNIHINSAIYTNSYHVNRYIVVSLDHSFLLHSKTDEELYDFAITHVNDEPCVTGSNITNKYIHSLNYSTSKVFQNINGTLMDVEENRTYGAYIIVEYNDTYLVTRSAPNDKFANFENGNTQDYSTKYGNPNYYYKGVITQNMFNVSYGWSFGYWMKFINYSSSMDNAKGYPTGDLPIYGIMNGSNHRFGVLSRGEWVSTNQQHSIRLRSGSTFYLSNYLKDKDGSAVNSEFINDFSNKWNHIVYSVDSGVNTVSLYVNGIKQTISGSESTNTWDISQILIGAWHDYNDAYYLNHIHLDNCFLYSQSLSESQVLSIFSKSIYEFDGIKPFSLLTFNDGLSDSYDNVTWSLQKFDSSKPTPPQLYLDHHEEGLVRHSKVISNTISSPTDFIHPWYWSTDGIFVSHNNIVDHDSYITIYPGSASPNVVVIDISNHNTISFVACLPTFTFTDNSTKNIKELSLGVVVSMELYNGSSWSYLSINNTDINSILISNATDIIVNNHDISNFSQMKFTVANNGGDETSFDYFTLVNPYFNNTYPCIQSSSISPYSIEPIIDFNYSFNETNNSINMSGYVSHLYSQILEIKVIVCSLSNIASINIDNLESQIVFTTSDIHVAQHFNTDIIEYYLDSSTKYDFEFTNLDVVALFQVKDQYNNIYKKRFEMKYVNNKIQRKYNVIHGGSFDDHQLSESNIGSNGITINNTKYISSGLGKIQEDENGFKYLVMLNYGIFKVPYTTNFTSLNHTFYFVVRPQDANTMINRITYGITPSGNFNLHAYTHAGFSPITFTNFNSWYLTNSYQNANDSYIIIVMKLKYVNSNTVSSRIRFVSKPQYTAHVLDTDTQNRTTGTISHEFSLGYNGNTDNKNYKLYEFGIIDNFVSDTSFDEISAILQSKYYPSISFPDMYFGIAYDDAHIIDTTTRKTTTYDLVTGDELMTIEGRDNPGGYVRKDPTYAGYEFYQAHFGYDYGTYQDKILPTTHTSIAGVPLGEIDTSVVCVVRKKGSAVNWGTIFCWLGFNANGLAPFNGCFALQYPGTSQDLGIHVNNDQDGFSTVTPPAFYWNNGLSFIHATWRYDQANGRNINRLKVFTLPHTYGDPPVHDSGDQVYTYATGTDLSSPKDFVLNSSSNRSAYLRVGGYDMTSHFQEAVSLSELHFYKERLTDEQEGALLDKMNTKWSAIA